MKCKYFDENFLTDELFCWSSEWQIEFSDCYDCDSFIELIENNEGKNENL